MHHLAETWMVDVFAFYILADILLNKHLHLKGTFGKL